MGMEWLAGVASALLIAVLIGSVRYIGNKLNKLDEFNALAANIHSRLDTFVLASAVEPRLGEIETGVREVRQTTAAVAERVARIEGRLNS